MKKLWLFTFLLSLLCLLLVGCGNTSPTLQFIVDGEVFYEDVLTEEDDFFDEAGSVPVKEGYFFGGWYFDEGTWKEPLNLTELNKDIQKGDEHRVYAKWETVELEFDAENRYYVVKSLLAGATDKVVIPSHVGDLPVAKIASRAFYMNETLTSVTIPDTVKIIGDSAFMGCTALTEVKMANGVVTIEKNAFSNCISLPSITLSVALEELGAEAFFNCRSLSSVTVPQSLKKINYRAFAGCTALPEISLGIGTKTLAREIFKDCTSLTAISYRGAVSSWEKVEKNGFRDGSFIQTVHCTNGDVPLS